MCKPTTSSYISLKEAEAMECLAEGSFVVAAPSPKDDSSPSQPASFDKPSFDLIQWFNKLSHCWKPHKTFQFEDDDDDCVHSWNGKRAFQPLCTVEEEFEPEPALFTASLPPLMENRVVPPRHAAIQSTNSSYCPLPLPGTRINQSTPTSTKNCMYPDKVQLVSSIGSSFDVAAAVTKPTPPNKKETPPVFAWHIKVYADGPGSMRFGLFMKDDRATAVLLNGFAVVPYVQRLIEKHSHISFQVRENTRLRHFGALSIVPHLEYLLGNSESPFSDHVPVDSVAVVSPANNNKGNIHWEMLRSTTDQLVQQATLKHHQLLLPQEAKRQIQQHAGPVISQMAQQAGEQLLEAVQEHGPRVRATLTAIQSNLFSE